MAREREREKKKQQQRPRESFDVERNKTNAAQRREIVVISRAREREREREQCKYNTLARAGANYLYTREFSINFQFANTCIEPMRDAKKNTIESRARKVWKVCLSRDRYPREWRRACKVISLVYTRNVGLSKNSLERDQTSTQIRQRFF